MVAATYLDRILVAHRQRAARDKRPLHTLMASALATPPPRPFREALGTPARAQDGARGLAVIAEVKRRSPSLGPLVESLDPAELAREYREGGAACLSVLTDQAFFGGCAQDLAAARAASGLPVLRKDFTVGRADVCDARLMGADAVLLIVAALEPVELAELVGLAAELGLAALVEVHDEPELDAALAAGADMVGVNQRDLVSFRVDRHRAERLRPRIPAHVVTVAESGVSSPDDAGRLAQAGYDAVLVGEWLVRAPDPAAAVAQLRAPVPSPGGPSTTKAPAGVGS